MKIKLLVKTLFQIGIKSFVKTLRFNIRYFGTKRGLYLPVWISKNVTFNKNQGSIKIASERNGSVKIGFGNVGIFDKKYNRTVLEFCENSQIVFNGSASIGHGSKISVQSEAKLVFGDGFCITANSAIVCAKSIEFGVDCLLSWDILIMDSDLHIVKDENDDIINEPDSILIGNNVWIGTNCTILKGAVIPNGSIIGASSVLNKKIEEEETVIVGNPARVIKENVKWSR